MFPVYRHDILITDQIDLAVTYRKPVQLIVFNDGGYHRGSPVQRISFTILQIPHRCIHFNCFFTEKTGNVRIRPVFVIIFGKDLYSRLAGKFSSIHTAHSVTYDGQRSFPVHLSVNAVLLVLPGSENTGESHFQGKILTRHFITVKDDCGLFRFFYFINIYKHML